MSLSDALTLILSIIAIIVSAAVALMDFCMQKKMNAIAIESEICRNIFYDYLVTEIPMARKYYHYGDCILSKTDKLCDALNSMRRDSMFFQYRDQIFYKDLTDKLQDLENYLINSEGVMEHEKFVQFTNEVQERLEEIYSLVMEEISGLGKRKKRFGQKK